jgi:hypothetical protein
VTSYDGVVVGFCSVQLLLLLLLGFWVADQSFENFATGDQSAHSSSLH